MRRLQELKWSLADTANTCSNESLSVVLQDINKVLVPEISFNQLTELLAKFDQDIAPLKDVISDQKLDDSNITVSSRLSHIREDLQAVHTQMDIARASRWRYDYPVSGEHGVNDHNYVVEQWLRSKRVLTNELNATVVDEVIEKMPAADVVELLEELCLEDIRFEGEPIDKIILSDKHPMSAQIVMTNDKKMVQLTVPIVGVQIGSMLTRQQATVDLQSNKAVRAAPTEEQEPIMSMHVQVGFKAVTNKISLFYKYSMQPYVISLVCSGNTMHLTHNQRVAASTRALVYSQGKNLDGIVTESFQHWVKGAFRNNKNERDMRTYNRMLPELITFNGESLDKAQNASNEQKEQTVQAQIERFVLGDINKPTHNQQAMIDFLCSSAPTESLFSDYLQDWGKSTLRIFGAPAEQVGVELGDYRFEFVNDNGQVRLLFYADLNRLTPPLMMEVPAYQFDKLGNVVEFGQDHRPSDLIAHPVKFACQMRFDVKDGEITPVLERQEMSVDHRISAITVTDDTVKPELHIEQEAEPRVMRK